MTKSMFRLGYTLLISGIMVAAAEPSSSAGTKIQVNFFGDGFSGCFQYDQLLSAQSSNSFSFTGSKLSHEICYQIGSAKAVSASGRPCEPFTIDTNGTTFQLTGTLRLPELLGLTTVTIVLSTNVTLPIIGSSGQPILPFCNVGTTTTPVFQDAGTFTITNATTGVIFTGTITATNCTQSAVDINCSCPAPAVPAPPPVPPPPVPPPPVCWVYVCPASPPTCSVYAPRPRAACCLTRLFSRCSPRARCQ